MFDRLVWTEMSYGVEVWGWEERKSMERLEERYMKWVLGVDGVTPEYMLRKELQRKKLRGKAGRRAWGYKKRLKEGRGSWLGCAGRS